MAKVAVGHVTDRPFARTIYAIAAKRFTGTLTMEHQRRPYRVAFRDGVIVGAESSAPADSVGRIALATKLISAAQLSDALRALSSGGKSQLEALRDIAGLDDEQCRGLRRHALAHRAMRIFALPDADFVLETDMQVELDPQVSPLDPRWVIYHGVRTHYSPARLLAELKQIGERSFSLANDAVSALRHFGFSAADKPLLNRLRQSPTTIQELIGKDTGPEAAQQITETLAVVYALLSCDCLAVGHSPARARAHPEPTWRRGPDTLRPKIADQAASLPLAQPKSGATSAPTPPAPDRAPPPRPARPGRAIRPTNPSARPAKAKPRPTASHDQTRKLIATKLAQLDGETDHFAFLGVAPTASDAEIQKAYFGLAKQLHPDRLRALAIGDLDREAQRLFAAINHAFDVLSSPAKRAEYQKALRAGPAVADGDVEDLAARIFAAEEKFQLGLMAMRRHHFAEAADLFGLAVELNPEEGEHHALAAWATWCAATDKDSVAKEVRKQLQRAITASPKCVSAYYYRGEIAKQQGRSETAIDCFRKVLELQPNHKEAELELRLLTKRQEKEEPKRSTFLDRLRRK